MDAGHARRRSWIGRAKFPVLLGTASIFSAPRAARTRPVEGGTRQKTLG